MGEIVLSMSHALLGNHLALGIAKTNGVRSQQDEWLLKHEQDCRCSFGAGNTEVSQQAPWIAKQL